MDYRTVSEEISSEFTVSRSRFLSFARPAASVGEGVAFAKKLKKTYPDATHVVYAVSAPDGDKRSDDGEPKGTAGQPVLSVLKKRGLFGTVAVVRWFGGIKLGAGGLVEAYTKAAADALDRSRTAWVKDSAVLEIRTEFRDAVKVKTALREAKFLSERYAEAVYFIVAAPLEFESRVVSAAADATDGKAQIVRKTVQPITYERREASK